jgi:hypothetical protein
MKRLSKWFATKDSNVTIIGDIDVSQFDAPAGVIFASRPCAGKKAQGRGTVLVSQGSNVLQLVPEPSPR